MPYLHWETQQRCEKMADIIKEESKTHNHYRSHVTEWKRATLYKSALEAITKHSSQLEEDTNEVAQKLERPPLAAYLLQIAKIYNAMEIYPDVRMLRDYLYKKSPIHPRRTLDQSYYWRLPNTDIRDKDQVVYRETKCGRSIFKTPRVLMVDQLWLYILDDRKQILELVSQY